MADKAFLTDTTKCTGCKACQVACKQWNNLPSEETTQAADAVSISEGAVSTEEKNYIIDGEFTHPAELSAVTFNHVIFSKIFRTDIDRPVWQMMHKKCYHCMEPNCMKACPAEAIYKNDYWVVINQEKCIGCGECEKACIYKVPHVCRIDYNEYGTGKFVSKNKAYKCHACSINQRDIPACAEVCPTGAIKFDYRVKIAAMAKKRFKEVKREFPSAGLYGMEEFGGMHVITILKDSPEKFGLPRNPERLNFRNTGRVNEIYRLIAPVMFKSPFLKRTAYKITKNIFQ